MWSQFSSLSWCALRILIIIITLSSCRCTFLPFLRSSSFLIFLINMSMLWRCYLLGWNILRHWLLLGVVEVRGTWGEFQVWVHIVIGLGLVWIVGGNVTTVCSEVGAGSFSGRLLRSVGVLEGWTEDLLWGEQSLTVSKLIDIFFNKTKNKLEYKLWNLLQFLFNHHLLLFQMIRSPISLKQFVNSLHPILIPRFNITYIPIPLPL